MPEQRENSVLFSLKELRRIEDERIRQEEAEAKAKAEAERQARDEAERRTREEAQRRIQDEEDRLRRTEEEKVNRQREEQMRLQEAERRARVEGEMRLQEERMRLEMQGQKAKSNLKPILVVTGLAVVLGGGIIFKLKADADERMRAREAMLMEEKQRIEREMVEERRRFEERIKAKENELQTAKTEEDRARIRRELDAAKARQPAQQRGRATPQQDSTPQPTRAPRMPERREVKDDPLDGLKL